MKRKLNLVLAFILTLAWCMPGVPARALTDNGDSVVISHVIVGNVSSPRAVELVNNSSMAVDVTGWCLRYVSAGSAPNLNTSSVRACFNAVVPDEHLIIASGASLLVGSVQLSGEFNYYMTDTLGSGDAGKVYVTDTTGKIVDLFGWGGSTINAEGSPKTKSPTNVYDRRQVDGVYLDTDNNAADFIDSILRPSYNATPLISALDACVNMPGLQVDIPDGYESIDGLNCTLPVVDLCGNIDDLQATLPTNMERNDNGDCIVDVCLNIFEFQDSVPDGLIGGDNGDCVLAGNALEVTELLPNPDGDDAGSEFIEIYNPNDRPVDLKYYQIEIGDKQYQFDSSRMIAPRAFVAVYNSELPFSLVNTKGGARLVSFDGLHKSESLEYINAPSGKSWSLVDGTWQYLAKPTPAAKNEVPVVVASVSSVSTSTDCGEGRERNPATNRCRNIAAATSVLMPCKEGQYRSEETNRCRSLASLVSSSLKPCADDQFRNLETNRCRKIASADDAALADCGEGRERNPETNRCRNVLAKSSNIPAAAFAVEPVAQGAEVFVGWWALGGVLVAALAYAAWEWRHEMRRLARKIATATQSSK